METRRRIIVDTNALISRLLLPGSVPGRAVGKVIAEADVLVSEATLDELVDVLSRSKFDRYVSIEERQEFIRLLGRVAEQVPIVRTVRACRDSRDDMYLELAVNGEADVIITGARDLLVLHPFRGIAILTPARYLSSR